MTLAPVMLTINVPIGVYRCVAVFQNLARRHRLGYMNHRSRRLTNTHVGALEHKPPPLQITCSLSQSPRNRFHRAFLSACWYTVNPSALRA